MLFFKHHKLLAKEGQIGTFSISDSFSCKKSRFSALRPNAIWLKWHASRKVQKRDIARDKKIATLKVLGLCGEPLGGVWVLGVGVMGVWVGGWGSWGVGHG